jgi:energy-coupling factor transport system permease protein
VLITIPTFFILILNWVFVSQVIDHLLLMVLRFWGMTWLFNWFLKQVEPDDLAKALWALHIPYNFAWQISLAYRFIPMFQKESQNIYNIQISRGIPLDGKIIAKLKYLPSMSVPLIVMTQDKANLFSEALFARNWNSKSPKTVMDPLKMMTSDWIVLGIISCFFILFLFNG